MFNKAMYRDMLWHLYKYIQLSRQSWSIWNTYNRYISLVTRSILWSLVLEVQCRSTPSNGTALGEVWLSPTLQRLSSFAYVKLGLSSPVLAGKGNTFRWNIMRELISIYTLAEDQIQCLTTCLRSGHCMEILQCALCYRVLDRRQ